MKKKTLLQLVLLALAIFMVNCSVHKKISNTTNTEVSKTDNQNPSIYLDPSSLDFNLFTDTPIQQKWADSVYNSMTLQERLGQLFMVAAYSNKDTIHFNAIDKLITNQKIGGLIFFQGGPVRQAKLTNRFQSKSKIPLFIGNDAEWGLSMRLDSTARYPWNMTLGAIQDLNLIEQLGTQMAKQSKRLGLQFNFAPVLDINTNPNNPIIGCRSFGEDKYQVTQHAVAFMKGFQNQGIFCTGKHFPGHGDTETDSHHTLPSVNFSKQRLEDIEFYPYKKMFSLGLASVMVAHLKVPSLEIQENLPSSLSKNIVTNILQDQLKFKGLIFTDALNMKGASNFKKPGDIDLEAFMAGNDILLFPEDVPTAIQKLTQAYNDSLFTEQRLEQSVKKILKYKHKAGLYKFATVEEKNIVTDLNDPYTTSLQYKLYENAITVLKNQQDQIPIIGLEKQKIAYIKMGDDSGTTFIKTLQKYTNVTPIEITTIDSLNVKLKNFTTVIIGYHTSDKSWWKKNEFSPNEITTIQKIAEKNHVILDIFAKPYILATLPSFNDIQSIVVSYQNNDIAQEVSAQLLFGAINAKGKLPVSIQPTFLVGSGLETKKINTLGFSNPESVGLNSKKIQQIDTLIQQAITAKITPGAQILIARKGKIVYQKAFGYHTYDNQVKVKNTDLYDIASISKIVGTLPNVMLDYDNKKINLNTTLAEMLPITKGSNKDSIIFKDLLSHYARLQAWEPFYKKTLDSITKQPAAKWYQKSQSKDFSIQVAENLYLKNTYKDSILKIIIDSKLLPKKEYRYSDFTFILLKEFLEKRHHKTLDILAEENFFSKLGMNNTTYNPLQKIEQDNIVPTEYDTYFRHQLLQGYVHDMAAAMQGGVAGHAGIFSNTMDIAKIMQMYLQRGNYAGVQYFSEKTFDDFNTCYFCSLGNRRGLGFDKPQLGKSGPTCGCASITSFGHTGFTGTMTWVDPEQELIYVFLSNRTFPDSNAPNKMATQNIRENIQQIIYDAMQP